MSKVLFLIILNDVREYVDYFKAKYDYTGKIGFSSYGRTKNVPWPFDSLHMECHMISLTITCA
jgi:hypothetical protein